MRRVWSKMVRRCHDPSDKSYRWYGARGIHVCQEWRDSFGAFFQYMQDELGPRPDGHQIDRIDNDRGYEPGNLRWATSRENNNNRRSNLRITVGGVTKTAAEWGRENGIPRQQIASRIARGWDPQEAISKPVAHRGPPRKVMWKGREMSVGALAKETGVAQTTLRHRLERGISPEEAVKGGRRDRDQRGRLGRGSFLTDKVLAHVNQVGEVTPKEMAVVVGKPLPTVNATLRNLVKSGYLKRVRRGAYAPVVELDTTSPS